MDAPTAPYLVVTESRALRRGRGEKAVIRFSLHGGYIVSPYEPSRDLVPLKLEFDEAGGVKAVSLHFEGEWRQHFTLYDEAMRNAELLEPLGGSASSGSEGNLPAVERYSRADGVSSKRVPSLKLPETRVRVLSPTVEVTMKLQASRRATIGTHVLHGELTYQLIGDDGALPPQQLALEIPVSVVGRQVVPPNPEYTGQFGAPVGRGPKHELLTLILLALILVPLVLVEAVVCGVRGEDFGC